MKPPFDISGDLDTPVSAFMKLASFSPRFLLESVEGGERLARYSFIGFGDGLEVKLDRDGLTIGRERRPIPATSVELLDATGNRQVVQRKDIRTMTVSNLSIMPVGLTDDLKPEDVSALMAFLGKSLHGAAEPKK